MLPGDKVSNYGHVLIRVVWMRRRICIILPLQMQIRTATLQCRSDEFPRTHLHGVRKLKRMCSVTKAHRLMTDLAWRYILQML